MRLRIGKCAVGGTKDINKLKFGKSFSGLRPAKDNDFQFVVLMNGIASYRQQIRHFV